MKQKDFCFPALFCNKPKNKKDKIVSCRIITCYCNKCQLFVGGKIGIARQGDHIGVAVFIGVGLLHLDDVAIGLGHRAAQS
jgi:hypothetical protein